MFYFLAVFVSFATANQQLTIQLFKHLNKRELIFVSSKFSIQTVKNVSTYFILAQIYKPDTFSNISLSDSAFIHVSDQLDIQKHFLTKFPGNFDWIIENNVENLPYIPINANVWITNGSENGNYELSTAYQLNQSGYKIIEKYGKFSKNGLIAKNIKPSLLRCNFNQTPLIIFVSIPTVCDYLTACWHYNLWKDFANALNFRYVYVNESELVKNYGGIYDGRGVVAPFHATTIYKTAKGPNDTILAPILQGRVSMFVKDSFGTYGDKWLSYVRPFHIHVWICLAAWLILISLVIVILHYKLGYGSSVILETGLTPLDAICCQGATVATKQQKSRLTAFLPQIVAAVLFPAYAAAIVSFLTVHIQTFPFNDLEGLIQDGTFRIGYLKIDFFCRLLVKGNEKLRNVEVPENELTDTYYENMAKLCNNGKFVFLGYSNLFNENNSCKFLQIPSPVTFLYTGVPVAENSPYLPALRLVLGKMRSNGMINRIQKTVSQPPAPEERQYDPIPLNQLIVPFLILIIGAILSPIILIIEFLCKPKNNQIRRKRHIKLRW